MKYDDLYEGMDLICHQSNGTIRELFVARKGIDGFGTKSVVFQSKTSYAQFYCREEEVPLWYIDSKMTWDEIYILAEDKPCGSSELRRKDQARHEVDCFVLDNFGFSLEREYELGSVECVEDLIEDYVNRYDIMFDTDGNICSSKDISLKDKASEIVEFYDVWPDRDDKEFDTLDIVMALVREFAKN